MRKLLIIFVLFIPFCYAHSSGRVGIEVELQADPDDDEGVWGGPGFYYGIYFDNEIEYHTWHRNHHHGERYYDGRRHDGHGDPHRSGGRRHGGRH